MPMLGRREEPQQAPADSGDAHTILGKEARFSGKLSFEGAVRIDGIFEGEILTKDLLLVGPSAEIRAELRVGTVIIHGYVEGDVHAQTAVEIKAPGRLRGNVVTPALMIEKGVKFDGTCRMSGDAEVVPMQPKAPTPTKAQ